MRKSKSDITDTPEPPSPAPPKLTRSGQPSRQGQGGGPKTPEGKASSSLNRLSHGLCSQQLLLKNEDSEELRDAKQAFLEQFKPGNELEHRLVEQLAQADWFLRRANRREAETHQHIEPDNPFEWTEDQFSLLERVTRYRTTIERSFYRALSHLRSVQKERRQREEQQAKAEATAAKLNKPKEPKIFNLRISCEIACIDGTWYECRKPNGEHLEKFVSQKKAEGYDDVEVWWKPWCPDGFPPEGVTPILVPEMPYEPRHWEDPPELRERLKRQ